MPNVFAILKSPARDEASSEEHDAPLSALRPFRAIFEHARQGIVVSNADTGTLEFVNRAFAQMHGYAPEEMIGLPISHVFAPSTRPQLPEIVRRTEEDGHQFYESEHLRKDGTTFPVSIDAAFVRDENGQPLYHMATVRDISEEKRAEAERRYIIAGARCLLWYAEVEDRQDGPFLHWEQRLSDEEGAQRFLPLALAPGQTYLQAWYLCRPLEDRMICDLSGTEAILAGRSYEQEFRCQDVHGAIRWLREDVRVETILPGRKWRVVGVATDITDRKRIEAERDEKQAEVVALNARLQLGMKETHHRTKNNLQMIASLIDLQTLEDPPNPDASDWQRIGVYIRALAALHDLLTHDADTPEAAQRVDCSELLARIVSLLRQSAGGRVLSWTSESAWLTSRQGSALALVINELVSNSLKHSRGEISICFTVAPQDETATEGDFSPRQGVLTVHDTGNGFAADFDPQTSANTGLELVQTLARNDLNGSIAFANRPEGGACVSVILPIA